MKLKRIEAISLSHIKGIAQTTFELNALPNKPTLLVAPNGFGKSSFAMGFGSLTPNKLVMPKDHYHGGDPNKKSKLILKCILDDNGTEILEADDAKNEIYSRFDVSVISSPLRPKARKSKIAGTTVASADIEIEPVVLVKTIPAKQTLLYKHSDAKAAYGANGKTLPNISLLLINKPLMIRLSEDVDFSKATQVGITSRVETLRSHINNTNGSAADIISGASQSLIASVLQIEYVSVTVQLLQDFGISFGSALEHGLAALQIAEVYNSDKKRFRDSIARYRYDVFKDSLSNDLSVLNLTWKSIKAVEDKHIGLYIDFPKANQISNGERDIISFVSSLIKARRSFTKKSCILIIDELFDYLDDANLVACQYYISQMIASIKARDGQLFVFIMTHLDPTYFRSFCFKDQKVFFLDKTSVVQDRPVEKIIFNREDASIKGAISEHYLHHNPVSVTLVADFQRLSLPSSLAESSSFYTHVDSQLDRYLGGLSYEPAAVCCAVRLAIEKSIYLKLSIHHQLIFIQTHKTAAKLEFAEACGVAVPEVCYMLGIIYNEAMHITAHFDYITPIMSRLRNLTIKQMVRSATGKE
ncbi:hypothetical protein [Mesorhizobium sp.]|uniref:hypothetical protein n=1 Tax=Mesorhizobium sp. TaxID=1871066 RepID=UPI001205969F|nr:hypothetical protein [Mesorhizobium sp.]TIL35957.1 MAG: hypothetical protein E5Y82_22090 [Mesorhizobium sp.]